MEVVVEEVDDDVEIPPQLGSTLLRLPKLLPTQNISPNLTLLSPFKSYLKLFEKIDVAILTRSNISTTLSSLISGQPEQSLKVRIRLTSIFLRLNLFMFSILSFIKIP